MAEESPYGGPTDAKAALMIASEGCRVPLTCIHIKLWRKMAFKPKRSLGSTLAVALLIPLLLQPSIAPPASAGEICNFWPAVAPLKKSFKISDPGKVALQIEIKRHHWQPRVSARMSRRTL